MSKKVKSMIMRDYKARIGDATEAAVISLRGVKGIATTNMRRELHKKKIKITVVQNNLFRKTVEGSALSKLEPYLKGATAIATGGKSIVEVARELVALLEKHPTLELKGAVLDGQLFTGKAGVTELSKFPTREEALGQTVSIIVGPGKSLATQLLGPGRTVAGLVKAIEAKLEAGEAIAKVA